MLLRFLFCFCLLLSACTSKNPFSGDAEVKIKGLLESKIKTEFENRPEQTFQRVAIREKRALNDHEVQIIYETYFSDHRTKTKITTRSRATLALEDSEWQWIRVQPISQFVEYEEGLQGL